MHAVEHLVDADEQQVLRPPFDRRQIIADRDDDPCVPALLGSKPFDEVKLPGHGQIVSWTADGPNRPDFWPGIGGHMVCFRHKFQSYCRARSFMLQGVHVRMVPVLVTLLLLSAGQLASAQPMLLLNKPATRP